MAKFIFNVKRKGGVPPTGKIITFTPTSLELAPGASGTTIVTAKDNAGNVLPVTVVVNLATAPGLTATTDGPSTARSIIFTADAVGPTVETVVPVEIDVS